jgi:hypothetical protein
MFKLNKIKIISNKIKKRNTFSFKKISTRGQANKHLNKEINKPNDNTSKIESSPREKFNSHFMKTVMLSMEEESYKTNIYTVKDAKNLFPNHFKNIPVYFINFKSGLKIMKSRIHPQGLFLLSLITCLNYHYLIFPSIHFFPILTILTLNAYWKFLNWNFKLRGVVYKLILVDHRRVLLTFIDGRSEIILIENISLTKKMREVLILVPQDSTKSISTIEVKISNSKESYNYAYFLLKENLFVDLELLMAIICQHTKYITY